MLDHGAKFDYDGSDDDSDGDSDEEWLRKARFHVEAGQKGKMNDSPLRRRPFGKCK